MRWLVCAGLGLSLVTQLATAQPTSRPAVRADVRWEVLPIRSAHQASLGMRGGEGGQCIHGIARCPGDDRVIYLAVDVVGVWKSKDGGQTWRPCRNAGLYCIGTSSVAVHPRDPDRVLTYLDAAWEKMREPEEGLYYSVDGGETWDRVLAVKNDDTRRGFRNLIEFSRDGRRVYFAAYDQGLFRSDDGGMTWSSALGLVGIAAWEVRVDPRDRNAVWVATEEGLFRSTNGGEAFEKIEAFGETSVSSVAIDPGKAGRVYAVKQEEGLHRSEDGGKTWERVRSGERGLDREARHVFQNAVDPRRMILAADRHVRVTLDGGASWREPEVDWSKSYVQQGAWGLHEGYVWGTRDPSNVVGLMSCGCYSSDDNALSWYDSMTGYTGFHHGWSDGAVTFSADDPNRFAFFCYDYAFTLTEDGGRTFRSSRPKEQVRGWYGMYVGDMHPQWKKTPTVIAAAGNYWKNQLVRSEDGGKKWTLVDDTDGAYFFVRFHPNDPRVIYADDRRSDDGGKTFKKLARPVYAHAPSRPDTVYGHAEGKLWRSDDRGENWREVPGAPRAVKEEMGRRDIEVDPRDENRVWVMTPPDCAVFDGKAWRVVEASQWAPARGHAFVTRMAIDPSNPQRVVVGLDTHGSGYLFLSKDGGKSWADVTGNLPRLGTNQSLNIQPGTGRIFIGAGFGTWTTVIP